MIHLGCCSICGKRRKALACSSCLLCFSKADLIRIESLAIIKSRGISTKTNTKKTKTKSLLRKRYIETQLLWVFHKHDKITAMCNLIRGKQFNYFINSTVCKLSKMAVQHL